MQWKNEAGDNCALDGGRIALPSASMSYVLARANAYDVVRADEKFAAWWRVCALWLARALWMQACWLVWSVWLACPVSGSVFSAFSTTMLWAMTCLTR